MTIRKALDLSKWGGDVTADSVACFQRNDIALIVVQASDVPTTMHLLDECAAIRRQLYGWLDFTTRADYSARFMLDFGPRGVEGYWLDAEDERAIALGQEAARQYVRDGAAPLRAAGVPWGLYSRREFFLRAFGDWDLVSEFPECRIWDASYNGAADLAWTPYAGAAAPYMHQYHDTTELCDHSVDLDVFEDGEDPMTAADKQDLEAFINGRFLQLIAFLVAQGTVKLTPEQQAVKIP